MKRLLFILLPLLALASCCSNPQTYTLEVDYCDNRPTETITVTSCFEPRIDASKDYSVPTLIYGPSPCGSETILNVCDFKIISVTDSEGTSSDAPEKTSEEPKRIIQE